MARHEESLVSGDKAPERTEPTVREDNESGIPPDSAYGPSLRAEELETPGDRRAEAQFRYSGARNVGLEI